MRIVNQDIKSTIKDAGLHQYEVADKLGVVESTFTRWLRYDLTTERRIMINDAINELIKEKE